MISTNDFSEILSLRTKLVDKFVCSQRSKFDRPDFARSSLIDAVSITAMLVADMSDTNVDKERVGYFFTKARDEWEFLKIYLDRSLPENIARGVRRYITWYAVRAVQKYGSDVDGFEDLLYETVAKNAERGVLV